MNQHHFLPCGQRARFVDRQMRRMLADSLLHIDEQIAGKLTYHPEALARLIRGLQDACPYPPSTFALYAELVLAIQRDDYPRAEALLGEVEAEIPLAAPPDIVTLGKAENAVRDARYLRLLDTDPDTRFAVLPPDADAAERFASRLHKALGLIADTMPELAAEIRALVSQIILVTGDSTADYQFDGGSSYMLWGGLFLNVDSHHNPVAMVEVLAHECAHLLLFGFAGDEPLVLNGDAELFPSPLRVDLRPMDGIYHSTYVSARMYWAMDQLLAAAGLDSLAREFAENARDADKKNFYAGYEVVEKFARLTDTGRQVMASAKAYMDSLS
jgi:HEXXH motif-containing protein